MGPALCTRRPVHLRQVLAVVLLALVIGLTGCAAVPGQEDDPAVHRAVRTAFLNDDTLRYRSNVDITVFGGDVLLTGAVPDRDAGRRAARLARAAEGVHTVFNELMVADADSVFARTRDRVLVASARDRLATVAREREFDRDQVRVIARRGRLYLLGRVTRAQADAISEPLRRIRGVREVVRLFRYRDDDDQARQSATPVYRPT